MLTQKQREVPYIQVFKIYSGEEFIGKVVEETSELFRVENPFILGATQQGFQFAPFLMMGDPDKSVNIPKPVITTRCSDIEILCLW